ncbi:MAG: rhodanese-related sulfurtransferase [Marivirga sp.]|jgi:rhodanese-related sulfurtransferase
MKNLLLSLLLLLSLTACSQTTEVEQTTVGQLSKLVSQNNDDIVILDVRTATEVNDGHIAGSEHIDVLRTDEFTTSVSKMDKEKTYYVICRSGGRSSKAAGIMKDLGFTNVYNVQGGMTAWQAKQLPIE